MSDLDENYESRCGNDDHCLHAEEDVHNYGDLAQKGRWDYCVGLVGKPSAGMRQLLI
jgi:hypothetical protein